MCSPSWNAVMRVSVRDSLVSLAGVAGNQVLFFLCVLLMGRYLGPEVLGRFSFHLGLGMFLGTVLALRYELACVTDDRTTSWQAFYHVLLIGLTVTLVLLGVAGVTGQVSLLFVLLFALAFLVQQAFTHYLNTLRQYGTMALFRLVTNSALLLLLLALMAEGKGNAADVFAPYAVISAVVAVLVLLVMFARNGVPVRQVRSFLREHADFPIFILPSTLFSSVLVYGLFIVVPLWFDAVTAGLFALAYRLGAFPVSLLAQSVGAVIRRDAVAAMAPDAAPQGVALLCRHYGIGLFGLATLYALVGGLLFQPVVTVLLGESWQAATRYFLYLLPLFFMQILYVPLSQILLATRQQRGDFLFNFFNGLTLVAVLAVAHVLGMSAAHTVLLFSLTGSMTLLVGLVQLFIVARGARPNPSAPVTLSHGDEGAPL